MRSSPARWKQCLLVMALSVVSAGSLAARVQAHPSATSRFLSKESAEGLSFAFRFDATSISDLLERQKPGEPRLEQQAIESRGEDVLAYLDTHFHVRNGPDPCARQSPRRVGYAPTIDKLLVDVVYACEAQPGKVSVESTLFHDEDIPHQFLGDARSGTRLKRYFFSRGKPVNLIDFERLRAEAEAEREALPARGEPPPGAFSGKGPLAPPTPAEDTSEGGFVHFVWQGVVHIFGGLDHVLFVLTLLVAVRSWKDLAWIVTSFTAAHSITLALAALGLVRVSPQLVEPVIAASICYVALENMLRKEPQSRAGVTFGFGLVHGLGFGSVLLDLGLPSSDLALSLLGFNLGVEAGQLAIVLPLFPLLRWLQQRERAYRYTLRAVCGATALVGGYWCVERLFGG